MNQSEQLDQLFTALAKAQSEMQPAGLNAANPFFKSHYADLAEIVRVSRPALTKNGLCITQLLRDETGVLFLESVLGHSSGQYMRSSVRINPTKQDAQAIASYITYMRRYSYAALIGVVTTDEDDDGNLASVSIQSRPITTSMDKSRIVTPEMAEQLRELLAGLPDVEKQILITYKIQSIDYLPNEKFLHVISRIKEIKEKSAPNGTN